LCYTKRYRYKTPDTETKTLNYETVAGTLWGAVAILPIIVNGDRLTALNNRPNLAAPGPPTWGHRHSKMATEKKTEVGSQVNQVQVGKL
jgi:hypothetical protein